VAGYTDRDHALSKVRSELNIVADPWSWRMTVPVGRGLASGATCRTRRHIRVTRSRSIALERPGKWVKGPAGQQIQGLCSGFKSPLGHARGQ
jgi:hypothetical protein